MLAEILIATINFIEPIRQPGEMLDISISQEAEAAIDRGITWLKTQAVPTNDVVATWLFNYAIATEPVNLQTNLLQKITTELTASTNLLDVAKKWTTNGPENTTNDTNRTRFIIINSLNEMNGRWPLKTPMPDWREEIARQIINSQKITPNTGGSWNSNTTETTWAILSLRNLLGAPTPIKY